MNSYSSQANQPPKGHFAQYYRTPSSNRKMLPTQPLLYQQSPNNPKHSFDTSPLLSNNSPTSLPYTSNLPSTHNLHSQRNLFPPLPPLNNDKPSSGVVEPSAQGYSSASREQPKPKIVFSYSRKDSLTVANQTLPNSCGTSKLIQFGEKVNVGEFQLNLIKNQKKEKKLTLCSNQLHHLVLPSQKRSIKKTSSLSRDKYFKTAQAPKNFFKHSGTGFPIAREEPRRNKESKIASTEATRSFQAEGESSQQIVSQRQTTFDFSSIKNIDQKQSTLEEKRSTEARLLKKTMTFSRYDFGGIIEPEISTCPRKEASNMQLSQQKYKWKSHVKCLFEEGGQDLKQSIHCGPEVRGEGTKLDFLTGFGREIAESCIPESDCFQ